MRQFLALFALCFSLAACSPAQNEGVAGASVQLPLVAGRPGVAYFTLNGGPTENRLMSVSSPQIIRIELHESAMKGDVATMRPLEGGVAVPANGTVEFKAGGKHAMLFDINPKLRPNTKVRLTFAYANGRKIDVEADVKGAADSMTMDGIKQEHHH